MIKKTIGTILLIAAGALFAMLLGRGGSLLPHIIGPITLAVIGLVLLLRKQKTGNPAK